MSQFRVIICGGRDDDQCSSMCRVLLIGLAERYRDNLVVVTGAARGVDSMADATARSLGIKTEEFPAGWTTHGRAAGHIRNQAMLEAGARLVIAFKENFNWALDRGGTEDMVRRAKAAGVPVYVVQPA